MTRRLLRENTKIEIIAGHSIFESVRKGSERKLPLFDYKQFISHPFGQAPDLGISKSGNHTIASSNGLAAVGEPIAFNIIVINDGNVDLVDISLTDAMFQPIEGEYKHYVVVTSYSCGAVAT